MKNALCGGVLAAGGFIFAQTPDPSTANKTGSAARTVGPASADLAIVKSGPATIIGGSFFTYTITITNNGPSDATGVTVFDATPQPQPVEPPLPAGVTFISNSGACTAPFPCNLGTLTSGQSVIIRATYRVLGLHASANGETITNTAQVFSAVSDPNPGNNTSTVSSALINSADLSITKSGPQAASVGLDVTYQIVVSNAGPASSGEVTVTDTLPANTSFVSANPSQGICSGTTMVTCSIGIIDAGSSATISLVLTVKSAGRLTNTASVTSSTPDPNLANNTATTGSVQVAPLPPTVILILTGIAIMALHQWSRRLATH